MNKIKLHDIRQKFIDFFESKGHLAHPSYSLIPKNDNSLLLIGAGMAPLKKFFTKEEIPPHPTMTTCQKCVRTGDIDNVGRTARHLTFFEMLGNFSFGDYFKRDAINYAWEFLTQVLGIPEEKLWVSVYSEDDEAYKIWRDEIGVPENKIVKLGKEDNFWELEVGPSGPCSEIHYDRGVEYGKSPDSKPGDDGDERFMEVWNLVFTQFDKDKNGVYHPLSNPNIDTGMGLERIACVMEGVNSVYDVDSFRKIINVIEKISNKKYGDDVEDDINIKIIVDHARAMTFLVSDGVVPSNEGRGYVLRRLIRRAARCGMLLGIEKSFLAEVVNEVIDSWSVYYKDLIDNRDMIIEVINTEESRFQKTISQGIFLLDKKIADLKQNNKSVLDGNDVFELYDTYGFPPELTEEILRENDLTYDRDMFNKSMEEQKQRARSSVNSSDSGWKKDGAVLNVSDLCNDFKGYELNETTSKIVSIFVDNASTNSIKNSQHAIIVLDQTPFYGESGGQVGDTGEIKTKSSLFKVVDTQKTKDGIILHIGELVSGELSVGEEVFAIIDSERRMDIRRNHSATHLLHASLREVLGNHVHQAGSLVEPSRLRFDFTHFTNMTHEEIQRVESIVNQKIFESIPVVTEIKSLDEAKKEGVMGLFEHKYKDIVRVLKMSEFSKELCGGTHVNNTAQIGLFKIVLEQGVSSGVRRIEAITGRSTYDYILEAEKSINEITEVLKANKDNVLLKAEELIKENKEVKKQLEQFKSKLAGDEAKNLIDETIKLNDVEVLSKVFTDTDIDSLKSMSDDLRNRKDNLVIVFALVKDDKANLLVAVGKKALDFGYNAGNIVKNIAQALGGNGGGRKDMAMAGAKDVNKIDEVFKNITNYIK